RAPPLRRITQPLLPPPTAPAQRHYSTETLGRQRAVATASARRSPPPSATCLLRLYSSLSRIPSHAVIGLLGSSLFHVTTCISRQKHFTWWAEANQRECGHAAQIVDGCAWAICSRSTGRRSRRKPARSRSAGRLAARRNARKSST